MPCSTEPCQLKRGTNASIEIDFVPTVKEASSPLHAYLTAKVAGFWLSYPFFPSNPCSAGNIKCPLQPNTINTYKYSMSISPLYPRIKSAFKISLKTENDSFNQDDDDLNQDNILFCAQIPAQLI